MPSAAASKSDAGWFAAEGSEEGEVHESWCGIFGSGQRISGSRQTRGTAGVSNSKWLRMCCRDVLGITRIWCYHSFVAVSGSWRDRIRPGAASHGNIDCCSSTVSCISVELLRSDVCVCVCELICLSSRCKEWVHHGPWSMDGCRGLLGISGRSTPAMVGCWPARLVLST